MMRAMSADPPSPSPRKRVTRAVAAQPRARQTAAGIADIGSVVSRNLERLRVMRGLTLEGLAKKSGVSRGMLRQIELGASVPTISLLWKVAQALDTPFSAMITDSEAHGTVLMRADQAKILMSANGSFMSRALFPFNGQQRAEFYKLSLGPNAEEIAEAHAPGTIENLTLVSGSVEIVVAGVSYVLKTDDAIQFEADVPHSYRNLKAEPASLYLVMTYVEKTA